MNAERRGPQKERRWINRSLLTLTQNQPRSPVHFRPGSSLIFCVLASFLISHCLRSHVYDETELTWKKRGRITWVPLSIHCQAFVATLTRSASILLWWTVPRTRQALVRDVWFVCFNMEWIWRAQDIIISGTVYSNGLLEEPHWFGLVPLVSPNRWRAVRFTLSHSHHTCHSIEHFAHYDHHSISCNMDFVCINAPDDMEWSAFMWAVKSSANSYCGGAVWQFGCSLSEPMKRLQRSKRTPIELRSSHSLSCHRKSHPSYSTTTSAESDSIDEGGTTGVPHTEFRKVANTVRAQCHINNRMTENYPVH